MRWIKSIVILVTLLLALCQTNLHSQLLLLPKWGRTVTHLDQPEVVLNYPIGGWGDYQSYLGLEVGYQFTEFWAIGLDMNLYRDSRSVISRYFFPFESIEFSQWTTSLRAKRSLMSHFSINGGFGWRRYDRFKNRYPEDLNRQDPAVGGISQNFITLQVGSEINYKNVVIGATYHAGTYVGARASFFANSVQSFELYLTYLFKIGLRRPSRRKNCPRF